MLCIPFCQGRKPGFESRLHSGGASAQDLCHSAIKEASMVMISAIDVLFSGYRKYLDLIFIYLLDLTEIFDF
jgi:hypothetical protein